MVPTEVGGLTLDDEYYHLMNIKFKVSGEHPISGIRFPAEIQLVHKHAITDKMLIVAIPTTHPSGPSGFGGTSNLTFNASAGKFSGVPARLSPQNQNRALLERSIFWTSRRPVFGVNDVRKFARELLNK